MSLWQRLFRLWWLTLDEWYRILAHMSHVSQEHEILIDVCKCHPLLEVLNRNKTLNEEKTERRTRNHSMHFLCFLGTFGEEGYNNSNSRSRRTQGCGAYENMWNTYMKIIFHFVKKSHLHWPNEKRKEWDFPTNMEQARIGKLCRLLRRHFFPSVFQNPKRGLWGLSWQKARLQHISFNSF